MDWAGDDKVFRKKRGVNTLQEGVLQRMWGVVTYADNEPTPHRNLNKRAGGSWHKSAQYAECKPGFIQRVLCWKTLQATIAELQSFQAKVNTNIVLSDDNRGTSKNLVANSIETNMPVSIPVKMVIFKGFSAEAFTVDILFCVKNQSVECWLDSADAAYWAEKQKEEIIDVLLQDFIADGIAVIES